MAQIGSREDYRRIGGSSPWSKISSRVPSGLRLPVTYSGAILAICVIVFFIRLIAPGFVDNYLALNPLYLASRPWTLITYMFVHAGFNHLFWNMLFLFFFGMELERRVGENRFLTIFILSGIVAAFGQMLVSTGMMVGASGALYGVLGCLAIIAPEIRVLLFFAIPLSIRYAVILFALIDFLSLGSADSIAHMAHVTGLFVGLAFGWAMEKKQRRRYYSI
jgi:membrane associated rhomboid family serine protease